MTTENFGADQIDEAASVKYGTACALPVEFDASMPTSWSLRPTNGSVFFEVDVRSCEDLRTQLFRVLNSCVTGRLVLSSLWSRIVKLVDLVAYFRSGGKFEDFCKAQTLDVAAEVIEIYAQVPVTLESQLGFFPIERTGGRIEVVSEGIRYENLFDFHYFLGAIDEAEEMESTGNAALAQILLSYTLSDA
jgi:hypothetical protein